MDSKQLTLQNADNKLIETLQNLDKTFGIQGLINNVSKRKTLDMKSFDEFKIEQAQKNIKRLDDKSSIVLTETQITHNIKKIQDLFSELTELKRINITRQEMIHQASVT